MNISFNQATVPQILFGTGKIQNLGKEILRFGKQAIIVTRSRPFPETAIETQLFDKLSESGISVHLVSISNEPSLSLIDELCDNFRDKKIDVVVGIGGGSVLDTGKAISAMLKVECSVKDFLEVVGTKSHPGFKIPYIAIPTTSGTGSEATANAVLSEIGENGFKKSLRHPNLVPNLAIVDPELTLSCPKALTAVTGLDAFTQLLESYLSTKASPYTDAIAFEGLKHINAGLIRAYQDGTDIEARAAMAFASMASGITLANAGLGTVHGFASAIGAYFTIPHGVVCGTLMAACNKFTVNKLRKEDPTNMALLKYSEIGKLFSKYTNKTREFNIDFLIETLAELTDYLSIPKLSNYGIQESDFAKIISQTENKNNPIALSNNEMEGILKLRL
jgi:alcohol dehydrogenase class IV